MDNPPSSAPVPEPDFEKRTMLIATGAMCGVGVVTAAIPFVASLEPSARARAEGAPVEFDFSGLSLGEIQTIAWRGKPVWIMRRTRPDTRSARPDLFVCVGVCTHLGCSPTLRLDDAALDAKLHAPGGYYCPCHGSVFDLAGRVIRNVPAPSNLVIPDYRFTGPSALVIG